MKYISHSTSIFMVCCGHLTACGTGDGSEAAELVDNVAQELVVSTDFELGIQVGDSGNSVSGDIAYTNSYEGGGGTSDWACDPDCFDPDSARLDLVGLTHDNVANKDVRVCLQASDGRTAHSSAGPWRCTGWASQGTSQTGMATDSDGFDPDSWRVRIDTRAWPQNVDQSIDLKFRIRAWDKASGSVYYAGSWSTYTPVSSSGGGYSGWTSGPFTHDPDGFEIQMHVAQTGVSSFCSAARRCQHGFGDCDSNSDCVSGTTCHKNVGHQFGYVDNGIDVCVD